MHGQLKENFLSVLSEMEQVKELKQLSRYEEELQRLRTRLEDDEFRIAVVGEFSSGKSTFINALLGQDVLQHATKETTAALTRIVNVKKEDPRSKTGMVFFEDGTKLPLSDFSELKEYTTTNSEKYDVVSKVSQVELYLPMIDSGRSIVFVDTPGLNGTADGHRERTVQLIQKAHSCIYLLARRGLAESDIEFLRYLVQYQKNFLFIQNFIDDLHRSEGDDLEEKLRAQRELLDQNVFAPADGCHYEICGISALKALAGQDTSVRLYGASEDPLTPGERAALYEQSKFADLRRILAEMFREDRLEQLQYYDTALAIYEWVDVLLKQLKWREEQVDAVYRISTDRRAVEKLAGLKQRVIENQTRHTKFLTDFVSSKCAGIQRNTLVQVREQITRLNEAFSAEISGQRKLEDLEKYEKGLQNNLESGKARTVQEHNDDCRLQLQRLYQVLLARIEEYSGIHAVDLEPQTWSPQISLQDQNAFRKEEDAIQKRKNELDAKKAERNRNADALSRIGRESQLTEDEIARINRQKRSAEEEKTYRIARLGPRPRIEERDESYTAYEERGGLGILDALFGPREVTRWRKVEDDSARRAWDSQKAEIENACVREHSELTRQLGAAQRRKQMLLDDRHQHEEKLADLGRRIQQLEKRLAEEERTLAVIKKNAKDEYLKQCKKRLSQQVKNHLLGTDGVFEQIEKGTREMIASAEKLLCQKAVQLYEQAAEQKLAWIENALQDRKPEICRELEQLRQCGAQLKGIQNRMKEWL